MTSPLHFSSPVNARRTRGADARVSIHELALYMFHARNICTICGNQLTLFQRSQGLRKCLECDDMFGLKYVN